MRNLTHPRRGANLPLFAVLLALSACTVGPWERAFWHPPAASGTAPIESGKTYPIARAEGQATGWPNLADVPARETAPFTPEQVTSETLGLEADRASASQPAMAAKATPAGSALVVPTPPPEISGE
jgi:hypothetical protein